MSLEVSPNNLRYSFSPSWKNKMDLAIAYPNCFVCSTPGYSVEGPEWLILATFLERAAVDQWTLGSE